MDEMLPSSGEEYLRMVRAQARSCPAVVVAPKAQEYLSVKNTSLKYRTDWNSCHPAPKGCAPTAEWRECFMDEFMTARANFKEYSQRQGRPEKRRRIQTSSSVEDQQDGQCRISTHDGSNETSSTLLSTVNPATITLPQMFDERGWRTLLYGSNVVSMSVPGSTAASTTTTLLTSTQESEAIQATESSTLRSPGQGMMPQPRFLMRLNQGHLIQLLKYHLRWLAEDDVSEQEGRWMYALFLKLDPLVESDQTSILRSLAKKCARIRSHLNSDSGSKLATINMVITIVARLFGQSDLE